jgi:6-phospho-beta-glucosidase
MPRERRRRGDHPARVGGQAARISDETFPLACGCVGQETTGAGGPGQGVRTVPVVLDSRGPGSGARGKAGGLDRRLHQPGRHRHPARCSTPAQRVGPVQRGDRLPAPVRRPAGRRPGASSSTTRPNHLTWERAAYVDGVDRSDCSPAHLDELAAEVIRRAASHSGQCPVLLPPLLLQPRPVVRSRAAPTTAASASPRSRPRCWRCTGPALTRSRPCRERGGAYYSEAAVGLIAALHGQGRGRRPLGQRPQRRRACRSYRPGRSSRCRPGSARAGRRRCRPGRRAGSGRTHHRRLGYEELALDAALRGGRQRIYRALLAHPLIGQHEYADALADSLIASGRR